MFFSRLKRNKGMGGGSGFFEGFLRRKWWALGALAVLLAVCVLNADLLQSRPLALRYTFSGPSGAFAGESGRTYVVDNAKKTVCILNEKGRLLRTIRGGSLSADFYYASTIAEDTVNGDVYVADVVYAGEGNRVGSERIIRFDANGRGRRVVYEISYGETDHGFAEYPMQFGRIKYLSVAGGRLTFITADEAKITVYAFEPSRNSLSQMNYDAGAGGYISDLSYNEETRLPVWITKLGGLYSVNQLGAAARLAETEGLPYQMAVVDGNVYYSELESGRIMCVAPDGTLTAATDEVYAYYLDGGSGTVCGSDGAGVFWWSEAGGAVYAASVPFGNVAARMLVWLAALLAAGLVLLLAVALLRKLAARPKSASFQRVVIVLVVSLCIASVVAYLTLNTMFTEQNADVMNQVTLYTQILSQQADAGALEEIDSMDDYGGEAYLRFRAPLDRVTDSGYNSHTYYYYTVYVTDGEMFYAVCDYERTVYARQPYDAYGVEGYTDVMETGATVQIDSETSAWGTYSYALCPILDEDGAVVGVMEGGISLDNLKAEQRALVIEIVLTVAAAAVTMVMLILEGVFYLEQRRRYPGEALTLADRLERIPLRTLFFLSLLADSLQDPFVSVLSGELYVPFWGISQSIGAALPISAEVLMAAVFSFLGGFLVPRLGTRRTLTVGFAVQLGGFLLCALFETYWGLLLGKTLAGAGMGLIAVGCNAVAAAGSDEGFHMRAFGDISAGMLAGVSAGAGLGSILLSVSSYRFVFLAGVGILLVGGFMNLGSQDYREAARAGERVDRAEARETGFLRFFFNRKVFGLLVLALLPFTAGVSFRSYFLPIYAVGIGMSEAAIGRILLGCGLFVIYGGQPLTAFLVNRVGVYGTVIVSGAVMALSTMLFALFPTEWALIAATFFISMVIGVGGVSQSTYFSQQRVTGEFGESRAMGIYTVFDNGGQTLGPVLYGAALVLGSQAGVLIVGVILTLLCSAFVCTTTDGVKKKKGKDKKIVVLK